MTAETPRRYASHTEAGQHHEDRLPDLCRRGSHDLSDPANVRRKSNGVRQCRACQKEAQRRWREANRERYNANKRAEYERNKERRLAARRADYAKDPTPKLVAKRRWRERQCPAAPVVCAHGHDLNQPGAVYVRPNGTKRECAACRRDQRRRWRETHPDEQRAYQRTWMRQYRAQQKETEMAYRWHGQPWPTEQNPRRATDPAQSDERTHCGRGHELTEETTRLQSNGARVARICLVCEYERRMRSMQARRERAKAHP